MAGYGYTSPSYGYYKPPRLAMAAAGTGPLRATNPSGPTQEDPFGLSAGDHNAGAAPGSAPPISYGTPKPASHAAAVPQQTAASINPQGAPVNTAPQATPQAYDINTDPALQQIQALTGMNDEQANAQAMKQKRDQLLQYGDANLAQSLLGDSTLAQAAGQNPTSILAQLGDQRGRNVKGLTEGLNNANLLYSGYRVTQEEQAARDYQNALAQAAGGVNANLGGIDSQLAAALGQNQQARVQAMQEAEARHAQEVGAQQSAQSLADLIASLSGGGAAPADLATAAAGGDATGGAGVDPNALKRLLSGYGFAGRGGAVGLA